MKKSKISISLFALILGAGLAFNSASTPAKHSGAKQIGTEYQFNGTNSSQEKSAASYAVVSGSGPVCSGSALVCTINVTGDLQTWLNNHSVAQILSAADQTRN